MSKPSVAIVGCGNMGSAFAAALAAEGYKLTLYQNDSAAAAALRSKGWGTVLEDIGSEVSKTDVIILAVKPQSFKALAAVLKPLLAEKQIVISLMAGVAFSTLRAGLGEEVSLVRAMPNLPVKLKKGLTVYLPEDPKHSVVSENILKTLGSALQVESEELVDAATAVTGSGPGFVYYLLENYLAGSVALGFSKEQAAQLVRETFRGAIDLWEQSAEELSTLREQVTSKGGTTAAGLSELEKAKTGEALQRMLKAAFERAQELKN